MQPQETRSLASNSFRVLKRFFGLLLVFAATCSPAQATLQVPEIDPSTMSGALAMLASGFFLLTGSRRRK
jgi:hypothetical protein